MAPVSNDGSMSEYLHVEKPFLDQLEALRWTVIDQGQGLHPNGPGSEPPDRISRMAAPGVFRGAVRSLAVASRARGLPEERG